MSGTEKGTQKPLKGSFFGRFKWFKTFKGKLDQLIIRDFKYQNRKYGIFIIFEQLIRERFSAAGLKCKWARGSTDQNRSFPTKY